MWWAFSTSGPKGSLSLESLPGLPGLDGWLYGYSVFTTLRWPVGRQWLQAHLERVMHDAMTLALSPMPVEAVLSTLMDSAQLHPGPAIWRITCVAHPVGLADFYQRAEPLPTCWLLRCEPTKDDNLLVEAPEPVRRLKVVPYQPAWPGNKVGSLSKALHLRRQHCSDAQEEMLWQDPATGALTEATTANLFWFDKEGRLWTPPTGQCLPGITRRQVLQGAKSLGLKVVEQALTLDDLRAGSLTGGFLGNSVSGLNPVATVASLSDETGGFEAWPLPWPADTLALWQRLYHAWTAVRLSDA